ncbi:MAG TPA: hypothetical protein VJV39_01700 [Dongiaceae bacterium]|nr:hypothetical protein [Dongiaceae bacterium]
MPDLAPQQAPLPAFPYAVLYGDLKLAASKGIGGNDTLEGGEGVDTFHLLSPKEGGIAIGVRSTARC